MKDYYSPRMERAEIAKKIQECLNLKPRNSEEEKLILDLKKKYAQSLRKENEVGTNNITAFEKS